MLIFDKFPNEEKARAFMAAITKEFELRTYLCRNEGAYLFEVNYKPGKTLHGVRPDGVLDVFPFELTAPIVCVERPNNDGQLDVTNDKELVKQLLERDANPKSDLNVETIIMKRVKEYGGVFAGT
jgi:hypothetical protein